MQDGEDGHFDAEEHGWNTDFEIWVGENFVGVDDFERRCADGDGQRLPKGQENDKLDGQDLDEKLVLGEGFG